jgi:1-deoxy-D-xylulose-5-phosphate synthase
MALPVLAAAEALAAEGHRVAAVNARFLKPLDETMLADLLQTCRLVVTAEEGTIVNGFGAMLARRLQESHPEVRTIALGVADELMPQAPRAEQLARQGLTAEGIAARVRAAMPVSVR